MDINAIRLALQGETPAPRTRKATTARKSSALDELKDVIVEAIQKKLKQDQIFAILKQNGFTGAKVTFSKWLSTNNLTRKKVKVVVPSEPASVQTPAETAPTA